MSGTLNTHADRREILVVTGEASADRYAAKVVERLLARMPDLLVRGMGGPELAGVTADLDLRFDGAAAMGLWELKDRLGFWLRAWQRLSVQCLRHRPDVALLVDLPDFNLPLGRILAMRKTPVVWYISPQVWAWRKSRIASVAKVSKRIALAFSFEEAIFRNAGISHAEFVGHPLLDFDWPAPEEARRRLGLAGPGKTVSVLPGSRTQELCRHLPVLAEVCKEIHSGHGCEILVPVAAGLDETDKERMKSVLPRFVRLIEAPSAARLALAASDAALVCTGTATLEAALVGTPFVAFYKAHSLTYSLARRLIRTDFLALPNIVAGRKIVDELIQDDFTPERTVMACLDLLDPETAGRQKRGFEEVRQLLGKPGAAARVAEMILELIA